MKKKMKKLAKGISLAIKDDPGTFNWVILCCIISFACAIIAFDTLFLFEQNAASFGFCFLRLCGGMILCSVFQYLALSLLLDMLLGTVVEESSEVSESFVNDIEAPDWDTALDR